MAEQGLDPGVVVADRQLGWIYRLPPLPRDLALLARLDRPIGVWLLLLPCWWGLALAPGWPEPRLVLLMALGALVMRSAGCVINDIADRDVDARVERTRNRPLASGRMRLGTAVLLCIALLLAGLVVLLQLNRLSILLGFAVMPIVLVYPLMKRITDWPQAVLGLAFNWGALLGYTAQAGHLALPAVLLYLAGILWTLGYDTIYGHQDRRDDAIVGVRSTSRLLGEQTRTWLAFFFGGMLLLLLAAGLLAGMGALFGAALLLPATLLAHQTRTVRLDDPAHCLGAFRAHRLIGFTVLLALLAGKLPG